MTDIEKEVTAAMKADPTYPLGEADAMKWAVAWRLTRDQRKIDANGDTGSDIDGWMLGWFANAMASADPKSLLGDLPDQIGALTSERDELATSLETERQAKSQALIDLEQARRDLAAALKKASVSQKPKPPVRRRAGEMPEPEDKKALLELLRGGLHEVVFSDGEREIASLAPIAVGPEAWQLVGRGVLLREPVTVKPDRMVVLAGFALLDDEGDQIAWCAMAQPVTIAPGQPMRLDRQIVF